MTDSVNGAAFETPLGWCGFAWGEAGIVRACLPEADPEAVLARLGQDGHRIVVAPLPEGLRIAADQVSALLRGENADLSWVEIDTSALAAFERGVYRICREIPRGKTLTYGDVAFRLGDVSQSRAVGVALGKNPFPPIVPCHRVLGADGRMVGFSATGGVALKRRILVIEGALPDQADLFG
ncbi:methylated-DNA--[protein]-cysteine S-methyltransferase [Amorphus sp. 3PC139-8]|uniref:methylated-DNA--[protein]-cysteine S-methyltransferase n=1 Tax=Amorphus sp. 3PC139-8 TaxID=2735676 RepID=UPI00345CC440